jgi:hypothetical protein
MVLRIVKLVVALLVVYALYHFVPVYFRYNLFKDDLKQAALFGGELTDAELAQQVMYQAQIRDIPLDRTNVTVRRVSSQTTIETYYEEPIRVLPWYTYLWQVEANASVMHIQGGRAGR